MELFQIALFFTALLCSLVAGFLFAFAVVIMPGISNLDNREFIRAFQAMDAIIQNNQPAFVVVWLGSIIALIITAVLGLWILTATELLLLILATLAYLLGVQFPTFFINIPLNNSIQAHEVNTMDEASLEAARNSFEARWNRWNVIRTVISCLVSALLLGLISGY